METNRKMTEEEIRKALEHCKSPALNCRDCPYRNRSHDEHLSFCIVAMLSDALDLLKQKDTIIEEHEKTDDLVIKKCDAIREKLLHLQNVDIPEAIEATRLDVMQDILSTLEAEAESSDKYIREYDDNKEQKAYNKGLWDAVNTVKDMTLSHITKGAKEMGYDVSMIDGHIEEPKGLSDEEIIKAFENCYCTTTCDGCPFEDEDECCKDDDTLEGKVVDLLKRLKRDNELKRIKIEKLQHELDTLKSRK